MKQRSNLARTRRSSRRDFLKSSATVLGTAAIGELVAARFAHAAGSDTIRLGLIGCGDRGTGAALQALVADRGAKLVAMADVFKDHAFGSRDHLRQQKPDRRQYCKRRGSRNRRLQVL